MRDLYFLDMTMPAGDIVIEHKSSGTQLIQDLQNDGAINVVEYRPPAGTDKVMRLHACSDRFENGRVLSPENAPWLDDYRRTHRLPRHETRRPGRLDHPGAGLIARAQCDRNHDQSLHLIRGSVGFPAAGLGQWPERPESTSTGLSGFATVRVAIRWAKVSR
jgi:hypothetical protein